MIDLSSHEMVSTMLIGIGATLITDVWAFALKKIADIPSFNFCLLGRWIGHLRYGRFIHVGVAQATPQPAECFLGWTIHYVIGIVFVLMLVTLFTSPTWLHQPSFLPALWFGIGSVVFPFFMLHPALGMGVAARRTPKPWAARLKSTITHAVFGCGLYVSALLLNLISAL